jgi:hypothetical protein
MSKDKRFRFLFLSILFFLFTFHGISGTCFALSDEEVRRFQSQLADESTGQRIAFWAEKFLGVPYDKDPLGEYVARQIVVADERVDCMYLTFRAVELALSKTPEGAIQNALDKRFRSKGLLKDGKVVNYEDRFEYGEDMIDSGKWGREITADVGRLLRIPGSRGRDFVEILSVTALSQGMDRLKTGDLLFFIKKPEKRVVEEIVGHLGIVKVEEKRDNRLPGETYLIHASGAKGKGGEVKKVLLRDYLSRTVYIGARITRFD